MATNWQIGRVGSIDLTGKWEDKSVTFHDYWENDGSTWSADIVWTFTGTSWPQVQRWSFTGKGVARDSD